MRFLANIFREGRFANKEEEGWEFEGETLIFLINGVTHLKAAVIDVGTNTVKLTVGEKDKNGRIRVLADSANVSRLGENLDTEGMLQPQSQQRTIAAIANFIKTANDLRASNIRIVATSAMRDARNSQEFVSLVKSQLGIDLEILSEEDEGRLSYSSVASDPELGAYKGTLAVVDIGGGSTEITFGEDSGIILSNSVRIGAVRLTERILKSDPPDPDEIGKARALASESIREAAGARQASRIVQVGGSAVNVARIFKHVPPSMTSEVHGTILTPIEMRRMLDFLSGMSLEQKKTIVGLEPDRADIILAGAIILDSVMSVLNASELLISTRGLRHGVLYEMLGSS